MITLRSIHFRSIAIGALTFLLAFAILQLMATSRQQNHGEDPVSLAELAIIGGATELDMSPAEVADSADLVMEVVVRDIKRSRLNTSDGAFPTASEIDSKGLGDLTIFTEIEVETVEVLGPTDRRGEPKAGDTFTVVIGGGAFFGPLDADQAAALGVAETRVEDRTVDGRTIEVEVEVPIDGPVDDFVWGSAPEEELVEGQRVVMFLSEFDLPGYDKSQTIRVYGPVHSHGLLYSDGSNGWTSQDGQAVQLEQLVELAG